MLRNTKVVRKLSRLVLIGMITFILVSCNGNSNENNGAGMDTASGVVNTPPHDTSAVVTPPPTNDSNVVNPDSSGISR